MIEMHWSHIGALVQIPTVPLQIQLHMQVSGKAVEDGSNVGTMLSIWETRMEFLVIGFSLALTWLVWSI